MGSEAAMRRPQTRRGGGLDPMAILNAMAYPVIVVSADDRIEYVNGAAEQLFASSFAILHDAPLEELIPKDSPLHGLVSQARVDQASVSQDAITLESPRMGRHLASAVAAPAGDSSDSVVLTLHERSIASAIDRQLTHRNAARSVTAMAAMLAHEVKNPLSGIRGAAQLLEQGIGERDRELTQLICKEADRIVALVDRMEVFSDGRPIEREPVNIHEILERVRQVAETGFGRSVRFVERYDPSLPPVFGHRDQLIQVFLNLVKNACEAIDDSAGEVVLSTGYQHGVRLAVPGSGSRVHLPLLVSVQDNGRGIPEDLRAHLFDPFVTTKVNGSGLGLALVAKIIGDHGGVIDVVTERGRTAFKIMLPMPPRGALTAGRGG